MLKLQDITYVTVVTVEIPDPTGDGTQMVQASVKLLPHDMVAVVREDAEAGHITLKPMRECTLAELAALADHLEADIPELYSRIRLADVADAQNATLTFAPINDRDADLPPAETFFDGASIVFPADYPYKSPKSPKLSASPSQPEVDESPVAQTAEPEAAQPDLGEVEDIPIIEPEPDKDDSSFEIVFFDLDEDSEADDVVKEPFVPETSDENRLAGRKLELDTPYPAATDILFLEQAFNDAKNHSLTSLRREVAGFIIGPPPEKQPDGRYVVHITQMIPAGHTNMQGASVTYTPESWRQIHDWLYENYPNEEQIIVGWYHTHPGFGIFLSNMDLFIHRNFFPQKWHIALVLDPVNKKSGYFCWDKNQARIMPYDMQWPYWAHSSW